MGLRCLFGHDLAVFSREGGDHTGVDAFLRCKRCGLENGRHVECHRVTPDVRKILTYDWHFQPTPEEK